MPSFQAPDLAWPHISQLPLADPDFLTPRKVDIIIGADYYGQVINPNLIVADSSSPAAQLSIFGWLVLGPVGPSQPGPVALHTTAHLEDVALDDMLTRFWVQEEVYVESDSQLTPEKQACEDHFVATHERDASGRYIVRLPLTQPSHVLGHSQQTAHRCLERIRRRLARDEAFGDLYRAFMAEYLSLGHMR